MSSAEPLLRGASIAADAVASMFGGDCEVAVHDLRNPTQSLVYLANGHVTGRSLGSPIRDLILTVVPSLEEGENVLGGYETVLESGARLKSTTAIIRDDDGTPVVAFCINYDTTRIQSAVSTLGDFVSASQPAHEAEMQVSFDDATGVLQTLVGNVIGQFGVSGTRLSRAERLQVVEFLEAKGAFRIKGSVALVAQRLGVSEPTVYRYITRVQEHRSATSPSGSATKRPLPS